MLKHKSLLDYTNLFSTNEYKNNDKIIRNYLKNKYDRKKHKYMSLNVGMDLSIREEKGHVFLCSVLNPVLF